MEKLVCVVILNLNGKDYLKSCLNSIKDNTLYKNYKVIIVDNNSSDGSQKMIKSEFAWVDLIENKINRGFSGGNNDGIKYATEKYNPDYFYLLNNDTRAIKGWLSESIKIAKSNEKIGIVGSKQLNFEGKPAISAGWIKLFGVKYEWGNVNKKVNWVSGAGFLIKKEVINIIGMFDEIYSPAYYEESDLENRTTNAGFDIIYCPTSLFYHKGGETTKGLKNDKYIFTFYRNRAIFFIDNYSFLFFVPRIIYDFVRSFKDGKLKLLIQAYIKGIKLLRKRNKSLKRVVNTF